MIIIHINKVRTDKKLSAVIFLCILVNLSVFYIFYGRQCPISGFQTLLECKYMTTEDFYHSVLPLRTHLERYARSLTANGPDADDLVQETMLRLWDMRSRLSDTDHLLPLAVTMVRNRYYDCLRHSQYSCRLGPGADVAIDDRRVEQRDQIELIHAIVEHLPPLQQRLFRMKEIEGYSADEIMRITGCSSDSLRKNLSRARMRIRQEYINQTQQGGNHR